MRFRTTWILLAVLVALAAFVFLWERKQPALPEDEATPAPTALSAVFSFPVSEARSLRITRLDTGAQVEFAYLEGGLWHITAPTEELADQDRVSYLIQSLAWLTPTRLLQGASDAADYELVPGLLRIEVILQDGTQQVVTFGAQTPAISGYYGQVAGEPSIYVFGYDVHDDAMDFVNAPPVAPTATPSPEPVLTETPSS